MSKLKWLLVGAGDISNKRVAPAISEAAGAKLTAVCDLRQEQAEQLAKRFGVKDVFTDFKAALRHSDADSVYLATPICLHADQAVSVLESGKHVLVEKPLALNRKDCQRVLEVAQKSKKIAACSYYRRAFKRYEYTKQMLDKGEFGNVVAARMTYFSWFNPGETDPKYWRVIKEKSGGGPLSDMGTHMFDVLIGLLGLPEKVYAKCANLTHDWSVEDSAAVIMSMNNGALISASFNWNSKTWRHEFEIIGTEAKVDWLPYDSGEIVKTVGRQIDSISMPEAANVHQPLIEDFIECVANGTKPLCTIEEALKTNILLDAIYESASSGREVKLSK